MSSCLQLGGAAAGLEPMNSKEGTLFLNIGERCNVAGSKRFCRLIKEGKYEVGNPVALVF